MAGSAAASRTVQAFTVAAPLARAMGCAGAVRAWGAEGGGDVPWASDCWVSEGCPRPGKHSDKSPGKAGLSVAFDFMNPAETAWWTCESLWIKVLQTLRYLAQAMRKR